MKIKYLLSCSLLAGSALFASCTSIEPKLDNDYKPLLPEEIPEGTITQLNYGELRAFPGAEGHGRDVTGGRGGKVYHVTSLEDAVTVTKVHSAGRSAKAVHVLSCSM